MSPILTFLFGAALLLILLVYIGTTELRRKRLLGTTLTVLAALLALYTVKQIGIKKGIDLQGGSEFVVELQPSPDADGNIKEVFSNDIQQAIGILEKRLNPNGEKDLLLAPQGEKRILIQMPGVSEAEVKQVRENIEKVAKLEFHLVHPNSDAELAQMEANGTLSVDHVKMPSKDGPPLLVKSRPDLDGKFVNRSYAYLDPQRGWTIILEFDSKGGELFAKLTEANVGRRLAIVVDGEVFSAPNLNEPIYGGSASITGSFKELEARGLASVLENPLENPMAIVSESSVSAAYGEVAIKQGIQAGFVALGVIILFMLFYYRLAGLIAVFGLVVNLCLLFGAMALFQFTLTMPGIAGIALTIGMAVDANVLIYERLREEMLHGKSLAAALEAAFDKAFSAIFDSNLTTLITASILFSLASGLVKGFAVTLTLGILSSLFGALIVTRTLFHWFVDTGVLTTMKTSSIIPHKVFDILAKAKPFIIASIVLTLISLGTFVAKGKHSLGIDFRGGALTHLQLSEDASVTDSEINDIIKGLTMPVKQADGSLKEEPIGTYYVQQKASPTGPVVSIRSEFNAGPVIQKAIEAKLSKDVLTGTDVERVGSLVGKELATQAGLAISLALIAIFVYLSLRFEFAFAAGATLALFHDVLIVPGLVVLLGQELSVIHIGAILAIAGYSINDTIIVLDRIREVIKTRTGSIRDLMNEAISLTLSRTVLTSVTTLVPMLVLLAFGNPAMLEFALPIAIGVLLGTYSSIFIAAPLVMWYAKKTGTSLRRQVMETHLAETIQPGLGDQLKETPIP
jgi:SecD/SecF fusion protein